jgi:hypothetical protein
MTHGSVHGRSDTSAQVGVDVGVLGTLIGIPTTELEARLDTFTMGRGRTSVQVIPSPDGRICSSLSSQIRLGWGQYWVSGANLSRNRSPDKGYERKAHTSKTLIEAAATRLLPQQNVVTFEHEGDGRHAFMRRSEPQAIRHIGGRVMWRMTSSARVYGRF